GVALLTGLGALVASVVAQARAIAPDAPLEKLAASVHGFDEAGEPERRKAVAMLVRELGALLPVPLEISALAGSLSEGSGKLPRMEKTGLAKKAVQPPADPLATPLTALRG